MWTLATYFTPIFLMAHASLAQDNYVFGDIADNVVYAYTSELIDGKLILLPASQTAEKLDNATEFALDVAAADVDAVAHYKNIEMDLPFAKIIAEIAVSQDVDLNMAQSADVLLADWQENAVIYGGSFSREMSEPILVSDLNQKTVAGLSLARMREISRQVAEGLFVEASSASCESSLRPDKIFPQVSVSFTLFAGAEFSITAEYDMNRICS